MKYEDIFSQTLILGHNRPRMLSGGLPKCLIGLV
jgi:hypothetical protein